MDAIRVDKSLLHVIESHIWPIPECGCWLWDKDESVPIDYENYSVYVDELIYRIYRGPVLENRELYHTCQMRCCVNPDHLALKAKIVGITKDNE
jgi:hypothetical protein